MAELPAPEERYYKLETLYARPGFLIRRTHQIALALFMDAAGRYGITPTQFGIMHILDARPGIDQGTVAKLLGHDRSSTALAVGNLQARELLEPRPASEDKRRKMLFLTSAGLQLFREASDQLGTLQNRILSPFTQEEQQTFVALLQKLVNSFDPR
jgi:DNA-binding MarR family transcriptional regulator